MKLWAHDMLFMKPAKTTVINLTPILENADSHKTNWM